MVHRFIRGSTLPLYFESELLIILMSPFSQVIYYVETIERACIETYRGGSKSPCHQYTTISISSRSENPSRGA